MIRKNHVEKKEKKNKPQQQYLEGEKCEKAMESFAHARILLFKKTHLKAIFFNLF